jgi:hypothetical protein
MKELKENADGSQEIADDLRKAGEVQLTPCSHTAP